MSSVTKLVDSFLDRDEIERRAAASRLVSVQLELERTAQRRRLLRRRQAERHDPRDAALLRALDVRSDRLWAEIRAIRVCIRDGSRARIMRYVRTEARLEKVRDAGSGPGR